MLPVISLTEVLALWCSILSSYSSFVSSTNVDPLSCILATLFPIYLISANAFPSSYVSLLRTLLCLLVQIVNKIRSFNINEKFINVILSEVPYFFLINRCIMRSLSMTSH